MWAEKDLAKDLEKVKSMWVGYYKLKEWEYIIRAFKTPSWKIDRVVSWVLEEILVEFNWNDRQFVKRIKVEGYDEVFSVKKFHRFYPLTKEKLYQNFCINPLKSVQQ